MDSKHLLLVVIVLKKDDALVLVHRTLMVPCVFCYE